MSEKRYYVENRPSWNVEYGSLLKNIPYISTILNLVNSYINIENKPLRILEYGCAYGYSLQVLKFINPEHEVYGVDIALEPVNYARTKLGEDKIFWQSCEERLPFENESVDLILAFEMVEHIADDTVLANMFNECNRLLKTDGYMFIKTPNCSFQQRVIFRIFRQSRIFKTKDHPNTCDEKKLRRLIQPYLLIEQVIYSFHGAVPTKLLKLKKFINLMERIKIAPSLIFVVRKR